MSDRPDQDDLEFTTKVQRPSFTGEVPLPEAAAPALLVQKGPCLGAWFSFGPNRRRAVVGRSPDVEFRLDHSSVSRRHAELLVESDGQGLRLRVTDLGSSNGVAINGQTIEGEGFAHPEDLLRMGEVLLRFRLLDPVDFSWARELSDALSTAQLDPLTGLLTRAALEDQVVQAARRSHRAGLPYSLVMLDIDHFKRVNDTWGHDVGDRVIEAVARVVKKAIRGTDRAVRYGGEEIAVALAGADVDVARSVADRIRRNVQELDLSGVADGLAITLSGGCAQLGLEEGVAEALVRADQALYRAKHAGRNRVEVG